MDDREENNIANIEAQYTRLEDNMCVYILNIFSLY